MQGDVYRNNHTGLEYVVMIPEVSDVQSNNKAVVFTELKSGNRETLFCDIGFFREYTTFVKNIYDKLEEK